MVEAEGVFGVEGLGLEERGKLMGKKGALWAGVEESRGRKGNVGLERSGSRRRTWRTEGTRWEKEDRRRGKGTRKVLQGRCWVVWREMICRLE